MLNTLKRDLRDRADPDSIKAVPFSEPVQEHGSASRASIPRAPALRATASGRDSAQVVRFPSSIHSASQPALQEEIGKAGVAPDTAKRHWRHRVEDWCARIDLAPDLASNIGSRTWFRGLGTLVGLSAAAIAFLPNWDPVEMASATIIQDHEREEYRSHAIRPLALGGDTGRHMGATALVKPLANVPERPSIQLVSTLGQGDSLARMLERAGLGKADVSQVTALIAQAVPEDEIATGTQFDVTLGKRSAAGEARMLTALDFRARFDLDLSIERKGNALNLVRRPIHVDATPLRIRGTVGSSLYRSARSAGAPISAIQAYLQALDKHVSLESDLTHSDQFDMIIAYKRSAKGDKQVGDLLYVGVERGGKPRVQLLRWGKEGEMYAANAVGQSRAVPLGQPVAGRITSQYGSRRHPILGYVRMHAGMDYGARYGSPIYAVADGRVTYAGRHGGHGNYVRLQHNASLGTGYAHMSRVAVQAGSVVRAGQVIGYVGSTGLSTGPHLHFEAYRGGQTINPAGLSIISRPQIDGKERDAFMGQLRTLLAIKPGAALKPLAGVKAEASEPVREIDKLEPMQAI